MARKTVDERHEETVAATLAAAIYPTITQHAAGGGPGREARIHGAITLYQEVLAALRQRAGRP